MWNWFWPTRNSSWLAVHSYGWIPGRKGIISLGIKIPIWSYFLGFKASLVVLIPMGLVFVYELLEKYIKRK